MILLVTGPDGRWQPGIGDPSVMGWLTVAAYAWTAFLCYQAFGTFRRRAGTGEELEGTRIALAWLGLAVLLAALGVNKQLDLQSWITQVAKDMAHAGGWYEDRRRVQVAFIAGVGAVAGITGLAGLWWLKSHLKRMRGALLGTLFLLAFIVMRAASFHNVDLLLYYSTGPFKLNWVFELGGIACIALNARREARPQRAVPPE